MIKKFSILVSVFFLIQLVHCEMNEPQGFHKVDIGCSFSDSNLGTINATNPRGSLPNVQSRVEASVPDFNHKFGEVTLRAINSSTNKLYEEIKDGSLPTSIVVPSGNYNFSMDTYGDIMAMVLGKNLVFSAALNNVNVPQASTIILNATTKQALVLVSKAGLLDVPTIQVDGNNSEDYPVTPMYTDTNYYYMYVYDNWGYKITAKVGTTVGVVTRQFAAGKIYRYDFSSSGIGISDMFDEVINNY